MFERSPCRRYRGSMRNNQDQFWRSTDGSSTVSQTRIRNRLVHKRLCNKFSDKVKWELVDSAHTKLRSSVHIRGYKKVYFNFFAF